ncbi:MAG: Wzz/FepE/Etk N-terminal domain-containing protein, partial [Henriciella sp.]
MTDREDWGVGSSARADQTPGRHRPRIGPVEVILQLWRAKWIMLLVFLPIFLGGLYAAFQMPTEYQARSRLYVRLGDESVFRPRVGTESPTLAPETEQLLLAELEVLQSPLVAERALERFPLRRIFPEMVEAMEKEMARAPESEHEAIAEETFQTAIAALMKKFKAGTAPKTPVISTSLTHEDPAVSAELLNAMIGAYLDYRGDVF